MKTPPPKLHPGEQQPDVTDGDGYSWPICILTREERERSTGQTYRQNPSYCNSAEIAAELVRRYNAHEALVAERDALAAELADCRATFDATAAKVVTMRAALEAALPVFVKAAEYAPADGAADAILATCYAALAKGGAQ